MSRDAPGARTRRRRPRTRPLHPSMVLRSPHRAARSPVLSYPWRADCTIGGHGEVQGPKRASVTSRASVGTHARHPAPVGSTALARPPGRDGERQRADALARVAHSRDRIRPIGRNQLVERRLGKRLVLPDRRARQDDDGHYAYPDQYVHACQILAEARWLSLWDLGRTVQPRDTTKIPYVGGRAWSTVRVSRSGPIAPLLSSTEDHMRKSTMLFTVLGLTLALLGTAASST